MISRDNLTLTGEQFHRDLDLHRWHAQNYKLHPSQRPLQVYASHGHAGDFATDEEDIEQWHIVRDQKRCRKNIEVVCQQ